MNNFIYALPLMFAFACGDKEEDTAVEEIEEVEETEDTGESDTGDEENEGDE